MASRRFLQLLFGFIFISLLVYTTWASTRQSVLEWTGLTEGPNRWWTIATLIDAYYGFITFYVWVFIKERSALARVLWFVGIMCLGNMAMSAYVLIALARLKPGEPIAHFLLPRDRPT